ncbi:MAG TPA: zinc ribbon domain-containing protein [Candidatus Mediterraneibacter norfolkensis]|nr:zinc ribbon domain-containing protein [Candidatus Mediterraneibacter norfolkensis]
MAFLTDLDKKISMLSQGAIQKTKEVTDTAKMSSQIRMLEAQKKEALEQLGKFYYDQYSRYGAQLEGEASQIAAGIQALEEQQRQFTESMQKIKGTMLCPNCGTEIPANSKFCNVCGTKIDIPVSSTVQNAASGRVCARCGAPLEEDQLFCINCGAKVEKMAEPVPQETGNAVQEEYRQPEPVQNKILCPNCGKEVKPGQKFCTSCGTPIE